MKRTLCISSLLIALAISFSFAQNDTNKNLAVRDTIYGTIIVDRIISASDSITIEALKNSQAFYDAAFKSMQGSYSHFMGIVELVVTIILAVVAAVIAIIGIWANRSVKKANDEVSKSVKKADEEVSNSVKKADEEVKKLYTINDDFQKKLDSITNMFASLSSSELGKKN